MILEQPLDELVIAVSQSVANRQTAANADSPWVFWPTHSTATRKRPSAMPIPECSQLVPPSYPGGTRLYSSEVPPTDKVVRLGRIASAEELLEVDGGIGQCDRVGHDSLANGHLGEPHVLGDGIAGADCSDRDEAAPVVDAVADVDAIRP